jgi:hypothetical protein
MSFFLTEPSFSAVLPPEQVLISAFFCALLIQVNSRGFGTVNIEEGRDAIAGTVYVRVNQSQFVPVSYTI